LGGEREHENWSKGWEEQEGKKRATCLPVTGSAVGGQGGYFETAKGSLGEKVRRIAVADSASLAGGPIVEFKKKGREREPSNLPIRRESHNIGTD